MNAARLTYRARDFAFCGAASLTTQRSTQSLPASSFGYSPHTVRSCDVAEWARCLWLRRALDAMAVGSVSGCSRSMRMSPAACLRFLGSFSRQRRSSRWIDVGTFAGTRLQSGSLCSTRARMSGYVFAFERRPPGQHLVQQAAERKDVGAMINGSPSRLLG
jgi:hypothetical protein